MSSAPLLLAGESLTEALRPYGSDDLLIIDVGAAEYSEAALPPYASLLHSPGTRVLGFDVHADAQRTHTPGGQLLMLPYAIGDGGTHTFRSCAAPMTSSLFEPNIPWLERFENLAELCRVVDRAPIDTVPLDDVPEARGATFLKVDVQGATLMVLGGARTVLADILVVQTEVEFGPIYQGTPRFGEVERFLADAGFAFHHFRDFGTRREMSGGSAFGARATRQLWADAIFVPDFERMERLSPSALLRLAAVAHDCYDAQDLTHACLTRVDEAKGSELAAAYRASFEKSE